MRIVVVATIANGIQRCDAADIGFWLTVALDLALIIMAIAQVHWRIYPNDTDMVHVNIF